MIVVKYRYDIPAEDAINIYTDGSCLPHPRSGGEGVHLVIVDSQGHEVIEDLHMAGYRGASNNQMELQACIDGLKEVIGHHAFQDYRRIIVHSDSLYVVDGFNTRLFSWAQNKWCNYNGRPIENAQQWKEIWKHKVKIFNTYHKRLDFLWVKGHYKSDHNKAADRLAQESAKAAINPSLNKAKVRRKLSNLNVSPGCVSLINQRVSIRIIVDEYLPVQRLYKYMYEVTSPKSPYFGFVDKIFSDLILQAGALLFCSAKRQRL